MTTTSNILSQFSATEQPFYIWFKGITNCLYDLRHLATNSSSPALISDYLISAVSAEAFTSVTSSKLIHKVQKACQIIYAAYADQRTINSIKTGSQAPEFTKTIARLQALVASERQAAEYNKNQKNNENRVDRIGMVIT